MGTLAVIGGVVKSAVTLLTLSWGTVKLPWSMWGKINVTYVNATNGNVTK